MFNALIIQCPRCYATNLHQRQVRIFRKEYDDDLDGVVTTVDGNATMVMASHATTKAKREPSILIDFGCEFCPEALTLEIIEESGQTLFSWKGLNKEPEFYSVDTGDKK